MADLATLDELKARLDWTLDADEERIAQSALEDASDLARHYAGRDWLDVSLAPRMARTLVLKACKRYMNNPEGYEQSRAGDETLVWNDRAGENAGTVYFTGDEVRLLQGLGGKTSGIVSAGIQAWGTNLRTGYRADAGYVPVLGSDEKPFPMFDDPDPANPW